MTSEITLPPSPQNKAELMEHIRESWSALEAVLAELSEAQMTKPGGPDGWSVKDHMVHIAMWEETIIPMLEGRHRHAHMGVTRGMGLDDMNAVIYERNKGRLLAEVLDALRQTHRRVLAKLDGLSDSDLFRPYSHYQPKDFPYNEKPILGWIVGNTYEHYIEHMGWMQGLIGQDHR